MRLRRSSVSFARQRIAIISDAGGMSKPDSRGNPVGTWSKSGNNAARGAVVHIEHTPPDDFFQAESVRLMLVDIVIQQSGNHIVSGSDGMEISCEM